MRDLVTPQSGPDAQLPGRHSAGAASSESPRPTPPTGAGEETLTQFDGLSALVRLASPVAERVRGLTGPLPAVGGPGERKRGLRGFLFSVPWLLFGILAVQAVLSLRLVWSDTASQDESLYLWAGHAEWAYVLHGTPVPPFSTFMSGAPVVYPPVGALADALGGLAGARILSMCFMLGATVLLWSTASRLFGRRAAFFAAAIWSVLGSTYYLGAYATFDAMSLFMMALAAWCAVHVRARRDETLWMVAAAGALVVANAAKYASAIFDPLVIALAVLVAVPVPGRRYAFMRGAAVFAYVTALLILLITVGGGRYISGIMQTTLARGSGGDSIVSVLKESWQLTGVVMAIAAVCAVVVSLSRIELPRKLLIVTLAGAGLLVPVEQARIHTLTSLNKHVDFGAWFAAIAVGYAVERLIAAPPWRSARAVASIALALAIVLPAKAGIAQSKQIFAWPNSTQFITTFTPIVKHTTGPMLVETPYISERFLAAGIQWERWSNTQNIRLPSGRSISVQVAAQGQAPVYEHYIKAGYFRVIALNFQTTPALDKTLSAYLAADKSYRVVATAPYGTTHYTIWEYEPPAPSSKTSHHKGGHT